MKTISKKLLSLLLTVAIVLQLLPAAVFAEERAPCSTGCWTNSSMERWTAEQKSFWGSAEP